MMIGRTAWMLVAGLSLATACASGSDARRESNQIQGKPPTPETDPFFYAARPPESAKAESTGMIGEPEPEPDPGPVQKKAVEKSESKVTADPAQQSDVDAALRKNLDEYRERLADAQAALTEAESKNLDISARSLDLESKLAATESKNLELAARSRELESRLASAEASVREARAAKPEPQPKPTHEPRAEPTSDEAQCFSCVKICPATGRCPDDAELVCGWGKGKQSKTAMLRASSECDAALDVVRRAGQWSRVDGQCPKATCNAP